MNTVGKFADPPIYVFDDDNGGPIGPPIYWDPKNPIPNPDGDIYPPNFRAYLYSGVVRDAYTEQPLAGATVSLVKGNKVIAQQAANARGQFQIDMQEPVDFIQITEVSHKPFSWPASEVQHTFDLEPEVKEGPPVILPPGTVKKKDNTLLWLLGIAAVAKWQKWI